MTTHDAYATALIRSLEEKSPETVEVHLGNLRALLARRGREALFPKIAREVVRQLKEIEERRGITLTLARANDEEVYADEIARARARIEGGSTSPVQKKIDERLVGGYRVETSTSFYDASHKKQLLALFNTLIRKH